MDVVIAANAYCIRAHQGQTRAHGAPYHEHPQAVRHVLLALCDACDVVPSTDVQAIALLHDVIEDTDATWETVANEFNDVVADGVQLLSKPTLEVGNKKLRDDAYYEKLRTLVSAGDDDSVIDGDMVRLVKVADRVHNLSELHLRDDEQKVRSYLAGTVEHVLPLALSMSDERLRLACTAALLESLRSAARAGHVPDVTHGIEDPAAPTHQSALPLGVYGILDVNAQTDTPTLLQRAQHLLASGVRVLQLRAKDISARATLPVADALHDACVAHDALFVFNDRPDCAWATSAHGCHLGQTDLPPQRVRPGCAPGFLLGISTHTQSQMEQALDDDRRQPGLLDYVAVGPVFVSRTKKNHAADVGLATLGDRSQQSHLPVVAIGGLDTPRRMADVASVGAHMAACISALDPSHHEGRSTSLQARLLSVAFFAGRALRGLPRRG